MLKIKDSFVKEILQATEEGDLKWNFLHTWDIFHAEYKGIKLVLEHTVEKSLQYDRLILGVTEPNKKSNMYTSTLDIDFKGNKVSNEAYDLLIGIRNAAIKNHNAVEHPSAA